MICFLILIAAGVLAIPRLRQIGFFGATTTTPPDIEISRKSGSLGVYINPDLIPSLTADVDPQYSGRTSTNYPIYGPTIQGQSSTWFAPNQSQDLLSYFRSQLATPPRDLVVCTPDPTKPGVSRCI
jgi:hypothetical protein